MILRRVVLTLLLLPLFGAGAVAQINPFEDDGLRFPQRDLAVMDQAAQGLLRSPSPPLQTLFDWGDGALRGTVKLKYVSQRNGAVCHVLEYWLFLQNVDKQFTRYVTWCRGSNGLWTSE